MNPDGKPDQSFVYGDANNDSVLDRVIPEALAPTVLNFSTSPPSPYLAYNLRVNQATLRYSFEPVGSRIIQIITFSLLWILPLLSAALGIWVYVSCSYAKRRTMKDLLMILRQMGAFYRIKFNQTGIAGKSVSGLLGVFKIRRLGFNPLEDLDQDIKLGAVHSRNVSDSSAGTLGEKRDRRCVLIATMEYE